MRGDFEGFTARFPGTEVDDYIRESYAAMYDRLLRARGTTLLESKTTQALTVGQATYALPADFYELLAIDLDTGNGQYTLEKFNRKERPQLEDTNAGWKGYPYYYVLAGDNIDILPVCQLSGCTLNIHYIPTVPDLQNDSDTLDGVDGWEEWIVLDAAKKMATKQGDERLVGLLTADLQREEARLAALSSARDRAGPGHVTDVIGGRLPRTNMRRWPR